MKCRIKKGLFDRWYLFHPIDDTLAWSGSQWASCALDGSSVGGTQIANLGTVKAAFDYAKQCGFTNVSVEIFSKRVQ